MDPEAPFHSTFRDSDECCWSRIETQLLSFPGTPKRTSQKNRFLAADTNKSTVQLVAVTTRAVRSAADNERLRDRRARALPLESVLDLADFTLRLFATNLPARRCCIAEFELVSNSGILPIRHGDGAAVARPPAQPEDCCGDRLSPRIQRL